MAEFKSFKLRFMFYNHSRFAAKVHVCAAVKTWVRLYFEV